LQESLIAARADTVKQAALDQQLFSIRTELLSFKSTASTDLKEQNNALRQEHMQVGADVRAIQEKFREEIKRLEGGFRLDLSLEKGRVKDDMTAVTKHVSDLDRKIETEVLGLSKALETMKFDLIRYLLGTSVTIGGLVLAATRIFMH
jgi:uncharacterized protein involved in exopolysaccharide biosynthesis